MSYVRVPVPFGTVPNLPKSRYLGKLYEELSGSQAVGFIVGRNFHILSMYWFSELGILNFIVNFIKFSEFLVCLGAKNGISGRGATSSPAAGPSPP